MKKVIVLYAMVLAFSSCSNKFQRHRPLKNESELPIECKGLNNLIEENWRKHKGNGYYTANNEFTNSLLRDYQSCLQNLKTGDIKDLFGIPNEEDFALKYFLNSLCLENGNGCYYLVFHFDVKTNKIQYVSKEERVFLQGN